jgi:SAM-dependent methyltransferase
MNYQANKLSEVFRDMGGHLKSSEIIVAHSTNKTDIREFALRNLTIDNASQVIDLGCGFGFFTGALKSRIKRQAVVSGIDCFEEYRQPYLQLCHNSGFQGKFFSTGMDALSTFEPESVDLILSSFSIYFFPEVVSRVASILRKTGTFILITHYTSHLKELTALISKTLDELGYPQTETLPHDKLIRNFPAEEGIARLSHFFGNIEKRDYDNELIFTKGSLDELLDYVNYKHTFFIPETIPFKPAFFNRVETSLLEKVRHMKECRITKNDAVFICTHPFKKE